ncbi:hypothetical protein AYO44_13250 [Planctomycetaceae bacterium SCGC AG-212-F19]|nr:hypothetical protein AYO44_13250 [Planctomycetaceae bacterium SCGC AG-212-F19]
MNLFSWQAVVLAFLGAASVARADSIVVPQDNTPFKAAEKDTVRVSGKGIAGAKIEAKVEGPAKIAAENEIHSRVKGKPLIGNNVKEFDLKATGKGKVKVTITVSPPQPGAKPIVTEYEYDVE